MGKLSIFMGIIHIYHIHMYFHIIIYPGTLSWCSPGCCTTAPGFWLLRQVPCATRKRGSADSWWEAQYCATDWVGLGHDGIWEVLLRLCLKLGYDNILIILIIFLIKSYSSCGNILQLLWGIWLIWLIYHWILGYLLIFRHPYCHKALEWYPCRGRMPHNHCCSYCKFSKL